MIHRKEEWELLVEMDSIFLKLGIFGQFAYPLWALLIKLILIVTFIEPAPGSIQIVTHLASK